MRALSRFGLEEILVLKQRCSQFPNKIVPISDVIKIGDIPDNKKAAAILIPLCNFQGLPSVIFTLRSSTVGTHKGQVSFPGGHVNEGIFNNPHDRKLHGIASLDHLML